MVRWRCFGAVGKRRIDGERWSGVRSCECTPDNDGRNRGVVMQLSRRGPKFRRFQAKTGTAVPTLQCYALAETFEGGSTKRPHIPYNVRSWPKTRPHRCPLLRQLSGVKRKSSARTEDYRS